MRQRLLLHSSCAQCAEEVIDYLEPNYEITVYFYSPNVQPQDEYTKRFLEMKELCRKRNIDMIHKKDNYQEFEKTVENYPEYEVLRKRCIECVSLRLEKAVKYAANYGYEYVSTTLSILPGNESDLINAIGIDLSSIYGISFLQVDYKNIKFKNVDKLKKELASYTEGYCGCELSKKRKEEASEAEAEVISVI